MKKLCVLVAVLLLVLAASCDTLNVGTDNPNRGPVPTITVPANMNGGADATWTVSVVGGTAPYTVTINFGGGATPNVVTIPVAASGGNGTATVTMVNASLTDNANYTYTMTATDSTPLTSREYTGAYVVGPTLNRTPTITSSTFDAAARTLTVVVADEDAGETLTVDVTVPAAFTIDAASKVAAQTGPLTAVFNIGAVDFLAGATGDASVTVTDSNNATSAVTTTAMTIGPVVPVADTLYAIPMQTSAAVGDEVRVVVLTGTPANPFQYMNGCGVTVGTAAAYVEDSFDLGAVDTDPDADAPLDGIWATMDPAGGFLLAPDNFIQASDIGGGLERWDFNVTPIGGADLTTANGLVFNFAFSFSAAGTYPLGFQEFLGVNRTYYTAADSTVRFWGDITNNHAGFPNTITVN